MSERCIQEGLVVWDGRYERKGTEEREKGAHSFTLYFLWFCLHFFLFITFSSALLSSFLSSVSMFSSFPLPSLSLWHIYSSSPSHPPSVPCFHLYSPLLYPIPVISHKWMLICGAEVGGLWQKHRPIGLQTSICGTDTTELHMYLTLYIAEDWLKEVFMKAIVATSPYDRSEVALQGTSLHTQAQWVFSSVRWPVCWSPEDKTLFSVKPKKAGYKHRDIPGSLAYMINLFIYKHGDCVVHSH